ncbi:hypothetical protein V1517DRAFT_355946 [Lipomyces orientalis]|uniref:Uncharacterized protein n=1 Tax=Lipomyces orientalis TaxID=1233043 RepID=A0ACC3TGP9_9ASCO
MTERSRSVATYDGNLTANAIGTVPQTHAIMSASDLREINGAVQRSPASSSHSSTPPLRRILYNSDLVAATTRKSSACPACRKQKIKCIMENAVPPCKRCAERGLLCSPSKSLQGLMKDQTRWNSRMKRHFSRLQVALNEARAALSLPPVLAMDEIDTADEEAKVRETDILSDDALETVEGTLAPDSLASAPIRSLYEVTKLRSIDETNRANGTANANADMQSRGLVVDPDFITRGVITVAEAEQLAKLYLGRLDHFFYGHLQHYPDFASIRKSSTLLALTVCTVASLHDPLGSELYDKLSRELRNLASSLMFRPRVGVDEIKALCMGCYWLADMSWMMSALVARKAVSMQYHTKHLDQPDTDREDFCCSQLWLLIYLSNEQISMLQGVPRSGVGPNYVNWEKHMASPFATEVDLSRVTELCGLDTRKKFPSIHVPHLRDFHAQLDRWGASWSGRLARNKHIGHFPSEAVKLHWHFSKLYICSHAFRGLPTTSDPATATLPRELQDIAECAITTAFSILDLVLESDEIKAALVGMPHYFHTMFAFAAVFLLKVATRYTQYVQVDIELVFTKIRQVLHVFGQCPCARQHLVHRIASGLQEMLHRCELQHAAEVIAVTKRLAGDANTDRQTRTEVESALNGADLGVLEDLHPLELENFDFLSAVPASWLTEFDI